MKTTYLQKLFTTAFIMLFLFVLAGCDSGDIPPTPEATNQTESADQTAVEEVVSEEDTSSTQASVLNFYNWDTYIDPQILSDFEEKFDVTINYQVYDNDEVLIDELSSGASYDLIVPSDYYTQQLWQDELLVPLNHDNIPNLSNLDPAFVDPVYDPGNRHCIPYQWGTVGFAYNESATGQITSWDDIFDPKNADRVALLDDYRTTMGLVLLYLGYSPNTTKQFEITEAADYLKSKADVITAIHGDDGQDLLNEGVYDIVLEYSGDVLQIMAENPDIRYFVPPSGSNIWVDNLCIPSSVENKELAETFINYLLEPEVGAALSAYIQYGSPNQAAIPLLPEEDRNNPAIYPPAEVRSLLFTFVDLDEATETMYQELWEEIRTAVEGS